jgi:hypothetical protein
MRHPEYLAKVLRFGWKARAATPARDFPPKSRTFAVVERMLALDGLMCTQRWLDQTGYHMIRGQIYASGRLVAESICSISPA